MTVRGDMDAECYFSECVGNATYDDLMQAFPRTEKTYVPGLNDKFVLNLNPGIYRMVFGVKACGENHETAEGVEYDTWEEYQLLNRYQYSDKEVDICFSRTQIEHLLES